MAKLMEGGAVKSSGGGKKLSFKGVRNRRRIQGPAQDDDDGFKTRSVREVIRLFESRHQGARVVAVKRQEANAKPSDAVILVRRASKLKSRVKPVLRPKPAKLSLPKDLSLLDKALESDKPKISSETNESESNSPTSESLPSENRIPSPVVDPKQEEFDDCELTPTEPFNYVGKIQQSSLYKIASSISTNHNIPPSSLALNSCLTSETSHSNDSSTPNTNDSSTSNPNESSASNQDISTPSIPNPISLPQESQNSEITVKESTSLYKIYSSNNSSKESSPTNEQPQTISDENFEDSTVQQETPIEPPIKSSSLYRLISQKSTESSASSTTLTPSEVENDILSSIANLADSTNQNIANDIPVQPNLPLPFKKCPDLPQLPIDIPSTPVETTESFYQNIGSYENDFEENNYEVIDEDDSEAIYDDVVNLRSEDLYEIIYTSQNDSDGSVDQRNSIYGMRPPSEASTVSSGANGSGNSDDWVDIDEDITNEKVKRERILVCSFENDQDANKVDMPNSKFYCNYREGCSDESDTGAHYESVQLVDDDSALCDDFSDDTDSESESLSSGKTTPNPKLQNGRGSNGSVKEESIYCILREAGKKTWSKSLQWMSRISSQANLEEKSLNGSKWLTLNKKNKRRHKSLSTFYITKESSPEPPPIPQVITTDIRRLSTALRPTSPPPPPPRINDDGKKLSSSMRELVESSYSIGYLSTNGSNGTLIYSDDKRSDTSSEHGSSQGSDINLRFADEPLYQFYEAGVFEREKAELEVDEDNYEELEIESRPSALDLVTYTQLNRTLWCQVPQVISSGVLDTLTAAQKQLQEAKFELMTSEASYYKSLTVLEKHFAQSPQFKDVTILSKVDYRTLFSNVSPVRKCSELVLNALDKCWQESILLEGICDVVNTLATQQFQTYVKYCTNQICIEKSLKKLKGGKPGFLTALTMLEKAEICHSLTLSSFLLLPMQRITRMPLLLDAILTKLTSDHPEYASCQSALAQLNKIVFECNEAARKTERYEELAALSRALVFPPPLKPLPLLSASRWLVRSGVVQHLNLEPRLTLTKRLTSKNQKLTLFLFTDYLIIAKKKSDDNYSVLDYCARNLVQIRKLEDNIPGKFVVELTMLENYEKKTQEMVICCGSDSSRERWLSAVSPPASQTEGEVLYEDWDCPQVTALHPFIPTQPDELQLRSGDSVNVLRKLSDGWYFGERIRDGEKGWFPGNYTIEIASAHMRARNLKLRYRFLAITSSYIQQNLNNNGKH